MTLLYSLPHDVILLILEHLEIYDVYRLQLTSQACRASFSDEHLLRTVIRTYPRSREAHLLARHPDTVAKLFQTLAIRTYHLGKARPRNLTHVTLRALHQSGHWEPTPQWDYHESQPGGRLYHETASSYYRMGRTAWKPYLFRPTLWTYDDGMLVHAPAMTEQEQQMQSDRAIEPKRMVWRGDCCLRVLDLELEQDMHRFSAQVPFDVNGKIIRNIRLKEGILVIEWAERQPFHDLNMVDRVHRHFATLFAIRRSDGDKKLEVEFRSEFKIHFLGFPLTSRDYFFTTHTAEHYALYYWQPNRSLWTGDEEQPIEALLVWDIGQSSSYRPSLDPSGAKKPAIREGAVVVMKYTWRELEWLGVRQGMSTALLGMQLDSEARTITIRENAFVSGQGYFDPAERNWCARYTTIPFASAPDVAFGPILQRQNEAELPSYRGHCSMESAEIDEAENWYLPIMDVVDSGSSARFGLIETCFSGLGVENQIIVRAKLDPDSAWVDLDAGVAKELSAMGRIAGDDRWLIGQNSKLQVVIARFQ